MRVITEKIENPLFQVTSYLGWVGATGVCIHPNIIHSNVSLGPCPTLGLEQQRERFTLVDGKFNLKGGN